MTQKSDGGSAFPITPANEPRMDGTDGRGMTLREAAALAALQGCGGVWAREGMSPCDLVEAAFDVADAFIAAREKGGDA